MPSAVVKPLDTFITNSISLLEANPSQTLVSISYGSEAKKRKLGEKDSSRALSQHKSLVSFRTHNTHLGISYKFKTNKSKDVSRLLSALGPRGVQISKGKIEKKKTNKKDPSDSKDTVGMSTLLVNTSVKEHVEEISKPASKQQSASSSSGKKKKKNKKR